ncbi:MAG: Acyl transferase [Actinomycetia bacterium]|nr:Acyl transferase [Actinomycetes bacterium]
MPLRMPLHEGEKILVMERVIVAPRVGTFRPLPEVNGVGVPVEKGQLIGTVEGPGSSTPVCSPFRGELMGMLAHEGERLREGQPVAWLRVS